MKRLVPMILAAALTLSACGGAGTTQNNTQVDGSAVQSTPDASVSAPDISAPAEQSGEAALAEADGLTWELETKKFSTTESDGREVYYTAYTYPVFSGEGAEALNDYVREHYLSEMDEQKDQVDDHYLDDLRSYTEEEELEEMLPFFDELKLDTVYADEEYVSISGYSAFWSGGAHPYSGQQSVVLRRSDANQVYLTAFVDPEKLPELIEQYFPAEEYGDEEVLKDNLERITAEAGQPEAFLLEEDGLRLFYNVGDAVPRQEILLPNEVLSRE